jgi:predicted metalloprotease with PDZ domain
VSYSRWCTRALLPATLLCVGMFGSAWPSRATIRYEVSLAHPELHLLHVQVKVPDVKGELRIQMPAWNALYQIRDFSSHMREVDAHIGNEKVPIEKMDKQTWRITATGTVRIEYATYWDEPGPYATQLNGEHAFINPAMILVYAVGRRDEKVTLSIADFPKEWNAAGALLGECTLVFGQPSCASEAASYDELVDAPIEASAFTEFTLPGVYPPVRVLIHGDNWNKHEIEDKLRRICAYELKFMGGAPYQSYTFIFHIGKAAAGGGGGMEHANSTAIYVPSDVSLPGVSAHEFFHLWNVKRIRPASLEPVDYTKEQFTRALWFAEGVTNTYGSYTLVRSGIWNKQQFYQDLSSQISELESRPAERWQSAEQSSLDAWLEKYSLYNQPQSSVSYYTKGQILGVLLDILIRHRTDNQESLDDVLRAMNTEFAKQGTYYRDTLDIRLTAERIAGSSFEDFFEKYVSGPEPLPYQTVLPLAGLELRAQETKRAVLGFFAEKAADGSLVVRTVDPDGLAAKGGLRASDEVISWNGGDAPRRLERWTFEQKPGELLRLRVRRQDKEQTMEFHLGEGKETWYQLTEVAHSGDKAKHIREGLLHGLTDRSVVTR